MNYRKNFLKPVLICIILMFTTVGFCISAELDDSTLFVEAFNAFQKKDYLLAIERIGQLNQAFPDSPLRDVTLLLLARSSFKSGDNDSAAKAVNQFNSEFPANPLTSSIEEELLSLGVRKQKGETIQPNKTLQMAANKIRNERVAQERAASEKIERERQAKLQAERDRIAREKAEAERKELERIAAEKAARDRIKSATLLTVTSPAQPLPVVHNGKLDFEISNRGKDSVQYSLEVIAPHTYSAIASSPARPEENLKELTLAAGETFKGVINFRIPPESVDGQRANIGIRAISVKFSDIAISKESLVVASAPLVRVVAKPVVQKPAPGEELQIKVAVLNVGSMPATGLTVRTTLPPHLDFVDAAGTQYRREPGGFIAISIDKLESGSMKDFILRTRVRNDVRTGQELRAQIEVVNGELQRKDIFTSGAAQVKGR